MTNKNSGIAVIASGIILCTAVICAGTMIWSNNCATVFQDTARQSAVKSEISQEMTVEISELPLREAVEFSSELIELTDDVGQNYFVNYRIKREQLRQEAIAMLKPLLEADSRSTRTEAQRRWMELGTKITLEEELENVLKLRGYRDLVSEVRGTKVSVTVLAEELNTNDVNQIISVTADITGFTQYNIEVLTRV